MEQLNLWEYPGGLMKRINKDQLYYIWEYISKTPPEKFWHWPGGRDEWEQKIPIEGRLI